MKKQLPVFLAIAFLFAGGGFFGGMKYQQKKGLQSLRQQFGSGQPRATGNRMGGRGITGEILNQDEKSLTVKLPDGSSKIVLLSESTTINKASSGTKEDLKTGEQVVVFGTENTDGSITAQNIQLNPGFAGQKVNQPTTANGN